MMIKFSQVSKKFGEAVILEDISFEIEPKEFVFFIGPTGAGKTTLIKLILREITPSSGSIEVGDLNFEKLKPKEIIKLRRNIGVVFQDLKLLRDRTVFENVALALKVLGKSEKEIEPEVKRILDLVGLEKRATFFPAQLAGGELQRVCIARAIVAKPEIVIADEPTGNLDPVTGWQIIKLLQTINKMGSTVIMATHNYHIVNQLKKRVIEIESGRLVSDQKKGKYEIKNEGTS